MTPYFNTPPPNLGFMGVTDIYGSALPLDIWVPGRGLGHAGVPPTDIGVLGGGGGGRYVGQARGSPK